MFDFHEFFQCMKSHSLSPPNPEFCCWFIGFSEGDGSFVMLKRGKVSLFLCTQSTQDVEILHYIQRNLGFGRVIAQGKRSSRYIVQDRKGCQLLAHLFNGNLVFPRRKKQFAEWLLWGVPGVKHNPRELYPTLHNGWISGYTDAEGCFTVSFLSNSNAFRLRFILSQKGDDNLPPLSHFIELFRGGLCEAHSAKENYCYVLSGVKKVHNIYRYFSQFPLKSKKEKSFRLWQSLHIDIGEKLHLVPEKRKELVERAKEINSIKRKSR